MIHAFAWILKNSLLLPIGAAIALVWANVDSASYAGTAHALQFLVNDIGMVFFFGLAAKEVVEATAPGGPLHPWRRAVVPMVGAVGGMVGPAILYLTFVRWIGDPNLARGWAIPCATDIAFSFLVAIAIFGRSHPALPFLLLLAIVDDALGLVILAAFYPVATVRPLLLLALIGMTVAVVLILRQQRVTSFWPYVLVGGGLAWAGLLRGGLHPALALVPVVPFFPHRALNEFEQWWKKPVQVILFAFGLVNAGVPVREVGTTTWAVLGAILAGKPIGIGLAVAAAVGAGFHLPSRMTWRDVLVAASTAGIGFTVALFFAVAAFPPGRTLDEAKLGALLSIGSAGLAYAGAAVLRAGRFSASRAGGPSR